MLHEETSKEIQFQINEITKLLKSYQILFDLCKIKEPDMIEKTALASVLHSFYNGLENIFIIIAKNVDSDLPQGMNWHKSLLMQMAEEKSNRVPIVTEMTLNVLLDYLAFRHYYRHAYSYHLDWEKLKKLSDLLDSIWNDVRNDILRFIKMNMINQ